jgi:uncharacterized repeat protein (TIGR01451 family)
MVRHIGRRRQHALHRSRVVRGVALLTVGCAGVFAAVATAAPEKKPVPPTTTVTTATTTTVTTATTTTATVTTATTTVATTTAPAPAPVVRTEVQAAAPTPLADIGVVTLAPLQSVHVGDSVTYTNVVTNAGPSTATGVQFVDEPQASARVLSVVASAGSCSGDARITCALGSLANGASAVVSVTLASAGTTLLSNATRASADQADPQADNNSVRLETAVLDGHSGAPQLSTGSGAFEPPLSARAEGRARVVTTYVSIDEPAAITVRVLDRSGKVVTLLAGSRLNYVPSGKPHSSLPLAVDRARRVPMRLLIDAHEGLRYRIEVRAVSADGASSVATIPFTT